MWYSLEGILGGMLASVAVVLPSLSDSGHFKSVCLLRSRFGQTVMHLPLLLPTRGTRGISLTQTLDDACARLPRTLTFHVLDGTSRSKDYYFDSYSHFGIHEEMLKDEVRPVLLLGEPEWVSLVNSRGGGVGCSELAGGDDFRRCFTSGVSRTQAYGTLLGMRLCSCARSGSRCAAWNSRVR